MVTARVLGAVLGIPVHGVCSLDVIAAAVPPAGREFLVATDARRREVYWARYDAAGRRLDGPLVGPAAAIPGAAELAVAGAATAVPGGVRRGHRARLSRRRHALRHRRGPARRGPARRGPAAAGQPGAVPSAAVPLLAPEPLYLRRPDAKEPGPPKRVTPS